MRFCGLEGRRGIGQKLPPAPASMLLAFIVLWLTATLTSVQTAPGAQEPRTTSIPGKQASTPTSSPSAPDVRLMLNRYCVSCHNERMVHGTSEPSSMLVAQLRLTGLTLDNVDA